MSKDCVLVTGAGGFIGHHLIKRLKQEGFWVRGVDLRKPEFEPSDADEFQILDLRLWNSCLSATRKVDKIYHLAADLGGIGHPSAAHASISHNNALINTHMLECARIRRVDRFFFASSASVYAPGKQQELDSAPLQEDDAYPAAPERGRGWEKLWTEQLCQYYREDYGLNIRIARLHNAYGPLATFQGGREKAPAALARKVALLEDGDEIEIWGDGQQTRSFLYIDDCVEGLLRIMASDYACPLNLGSEAVISIDGLVDLLSAIAGKSFVKRHDLNKPQGVRSRSSDNSRLRQILRWEPSVSLERGLTATYNWIQTEIWNPDISVSAATLSL